MELVFHLLAWAASTVLGGKSIMCFLGCAGIMFECDLEGRMGDKHT